MIFRGQYSSGSGCTNLWQTTSAECHMNMETGWVGVRLGPTRLLDSLLNSLMISGMHLQAPPEGSEAKGCQQTNLPQSLRSDKLGLDCCARSSLSWSRGRARSHCSSLIWEVRVKAAVLLRIERALRPYLSAFFVLFSGRSNTQRSFALCVQLIQMMPGSNHYTLPFL